MDEGLMRLQRCTLAGETRGEWPLTACVDDGVMEGRSTRIRQSSEDWSRQMNMDIPAVRC